MKYGIRGTLCLKPKNKSSFTQEWNTVWNLQLIYEQCFSLYGIREKALFYSSNYYFIYLDLTRNNLTVDFKSSSEKIQCKCKQKNNNKKDEPSTNIFFFLLSPSLKSGPHRLSPTVKESEISIFCLPCSKRADASALLVDRNIFFCHFLGLLNIYVNWEAREGCAKRTSPLK